MEKAIIELTIERLANGYLLSATKSIDFRTAYTARAYTATREQVLSELPALFAAAELLTEENVKDDF